MQKIMWLASYPKSGNTWLRMFLTAYKMGKLDINHTGPFSYDDLGKYTYQIVSPKPYTDLMPHEFAALRGAYFVHMLNQAQGDRLFIKTHNCIGDIAEYPSVPEIFTEGAIYLVRDPRDAICSYAHHCASDTIDEMINFFMKEDAAINHDARFNVLGRWDQHVQSWLDPTVNFPRHVIRYEDMIEKPLAVFGAVVRHLGWEYDETRLSKAVKDCEFSRLKKQEETNGFREQSEEGVSFFRSGKVGSWKDQLTDKQEKRIVDAFSETMEKLKYI